MRQLGTSIVFAAIMLIHTTGLAIAHHGWSWTTGGNIALTGIVKSAQLGNPHGVLKIDADGDIWTVQVGQPWRNERAGLKAGDLAEGVEVKIVGEPSSDINDKVMKAERIFISGQEYNLYPGRD